MTTEREQGRLFEVALELVRQELLGDDPFRRLQNAHRKKDDAPPAWTRHFLETAERQVESKAEGSPADPAARTNAVSPATPEVTVNIAAPEPKVPYEQGHDQPPPGWKGAYTEPNAQGVYRYGPAPPSPPESRAESTDAPIPLAPDRPVKVDVASAEPSVYALGNPGLPPIPLAGDQPVQSPAPEAYGFRPGDAPTWDMSKGGFGLGGTKPPEATSNAPAFDRPQPVIVMGPNPLPVRVVDSLLAEAKSGTGARAAPGGGDRDDKSGVGAAVARTLARHFAMVFGPLAALSTVLSQTNSGFGVFQKAVQLMGATIAPLVLPAFVLLATGLIMVSDVIWQKLLPALGKFYEFAMKAGLPAVDERARKAGESADLLGAIKDFVFEGKAPKTADAVRHARSAVRQAPGGETADAAGSWLGKKSLDSAMWLRRSLGLGEEGTSKLQQTKDRLFGGPYGLGQKAAESLGAAGDGISGPKTGNPTKPREALQMVMQSLQMSMGPRAAYSGLGDVAKQAQLAALNADPIEARMLKVMQDSLAELQKANASLEKDEKQPPNAFRRGGG